jgi:hypothetical protein
LSYQNEFFVINSLDVKENNEHALDYALHLPRLYRSRRVWTFRIRLMFSSPNACLITARASVAPFPRFTQNLMLFLCRIRRKIASGQIHDYKYRDVKKSARPPSCVKFCILKHKIC